MSDRWISEQIENWASDFLIDDAGDRVHADLAPFAMQILTTFFSHACSIRQVAPQDLDEEDIRQGFLGGLSALAIPEESQPLVPQLIGDFLADLQRRGRLAGGESHGALVMTLKDGYLRDQRGTVEPIERVTSKVGRNDPCPCGSGRKYKKCCLNLLDSDGQA
ncbi:MAG: SEC-C metal-binding domain-containing protein [Planctomycetota bacterium]|nr:SEC-C metal-binding domain-containing protein [Planctomycetota bacterium]